MSLYWLSFVDPARPEGSQFLGACIVQGLGEPSDLAFVTAVQAAHIMGINPGGECQGHAIPAEVEHLIDRKWRGRLLNRAECEEYDRELGAKVFS